MYFGTNGMTYVGSMSNCPTFQLQMSARVLWTLCHSFRTHTVHFALYVSWILYRQTPQQETPLALVVQSTDPFDRFPILGLANLQLYCFSGYSTDSEKCISPKLNNLKLKIIKKICFKLLILCKNQFLNASSLSK